MPKIQPSTTTLFRAGEGGYAGYRIPGLLATPDGTLLAYAEARRESQHDWGAIDVVARRSEDGGLTWSEPTQWAHAGPPRPKNPVALVRNLAVPGTVTANNPVLLPGAHPPEIHLIYALEYRYLFHRISSDAGRSWSPAREITSAADSVRAVFPWQTIAVGPGHGVRQANGRLVTPVWYSLGEGANVHKPSRTGALWSNDEGATWHVAHSCPTLPI